MTMFLQDVFRMNRVIMDRWDNPYITDSSNKFFFGHNHNYNNLMRDKQNTFCKGHKNYLVGDYQNKFLTGQQDNKQ